MPAIKPISLASFLALFLLPFSIAKAAEEREPIGTVMAVQGWAVQYPLGLSPKLLRVDSPIYEHSEVRTGYQTRLEIRFHDGANLKLGEWAAVKMEDYAFELIQSKRKPEKTAKAASTKPAEPKVEEKTNSLSLNVLSGAFRFVSGLIAKRNRKDVRIATPVATLGIRGTDLFGGPLAAGMPPGEIHYGFMIIDGAIDVKNEHGGVVLDAPNEGTFLPMKGHKAPTPPATWKKNEVDEAFAAISPL
ncbi:MAG: FecR family protein [Gammaproteobacteria bacterium]